MKKLNLFLLIVFGAFSLVNSQTVDSIKVEQAGELIKVHYKILNSNPSQLFRVTVYCSINGGLQSVIKSLSGDFGDNVIGGRSDYMVLWDVLKDVDEVKSVDFSVRAELMKDLSERDKSEGKLLSDRKFYVFFVGGGPGPKFGGKIGYIGSWGITAMYLRGKEAFSIMGLSEPVFSIGLDLTKRIVNANTFNMHLSAGLNVSKLLVNSGEDGSQDFFSNCIGLDMGFIMSVKRFAFSFFLSPFPTNWQKDGIEGIQDKGEVFTQIGLGYRF